MTLFGGATAAWPLAARAQQPAMPMVGFLSSRSPGESAAHLGAFRQGLAEVGYVEGQNVAIEYRWADGQYDRLPTLVSELVSRQVTVIAATGGNVSGLAAKAATPTTPIVFIVGDDPVKLGLVSSLNRPGGNATGMSVFTTEVGSKQLGLLHELVPKASTIGLLINPNYQGSEPEAVAVQTAARGIGRTLLVLHASNERDIDNVFATLGQQQVDAKLRNPITGIAGCCARAASGHAAAPPSAVSNSRRPMVTVIRPSRARCVKGNDTTPRARGLHGSRRARCSP